MTNNRVEIKVQKWADEHAAKGNTKRRDSIKRILQQINFLESKLYFQYEPSQPPNPGYLRRLSDWLSNLSLDEDQQLAFELASRLFFVGRSEITAMYRTAYSGPILRWIIDLQSLSVNDQNLSNHLETLIQSTWFCPITDSMKINEFIHINNIKNEINYRPDWQSLAKMGDPAAVQQRITSDRVKRIVLLEDFIATGSQARDAIQFAAYIGGLMSLPVLIVPLIQCYQAIDTYKNMKLPPHVTINPVLQLEEHHFVLDDDSRNNSLFKQLRKLAEQTYLQVSNGVPPSKTIKPYGPLGFGGTGGLMILATNTPDNTLPLVHWTSPTWHPLFPRHSRV